MSTNTELIARVEAYRCFELPGQPTATATHMGTSYLINDLAKAVEALEAERDDLRSQVDSLNVGFNNCQKERDAFRDERNRLNQLWGDAQAKLAAAQGQPVCGYDDKTGNCTRVNCCKQAQPERAPSNAIDAKRYRYWRENHGWTGYFDDGATNSESNDDVDKAIDAAIEQGGQQ